MKENAFQAGLIKELKRKFPGSVVLKLDSSYIQGIPDLIILHGRTWAALECKKASNSPHRPNQDFWVKKLNTMSFARFIWPENKQEVIDAMVRSFKRFSERNSRTIQSKSRAVDKRQRSGRSSSKVLPLPSTSNRKRSA